jgi:hypothetical protein
MRDVLPIRPSQELAPAELLIDALGLEARHRAEVADMYSRPIETAIDSPEREPDLAA